MKTGKKSCGCHIESIGHMPARVQFCSLHENAEVTITTLQAKLDAIKVEASALLHQAEYLDVSYYDNVPVSFLRLAAQEEQGK